MPSTQRKCIYGGLTLDVDRHYIGRVTTTTHQEKGITLESNPSWGTVQPVPMYKQTRSTEGCSKLKSPETSSGEFCVYIRTIASPKLRQDQVSGGVSVLCWHPASVANVYGSLSQLRKKSNSVIRSRSVKRSKIGVMSDQ